ncbi:hypothetical protein GSI_03102 [Ganoderma sinense ZZ0214-1]|uniref:Uncharacterized protein n=1 Tax=Ganoderma sinense ZZ0214-1 TaxID=1077348 RepID=A0A2G8SKQ1_9APHY|nr:hypothetical protein GSI_03102 [Ganoderma sinense ZZ0214-1]
MRRQCQSFVYPTLPADAWIKPLKPIPRDRGIYAHGQRMSTSWMSVTTYVGPRMQCWYSYRQHIIERHISIPLRAALQLLVRHPLHLVHPLAHPPPAQLVVAVHDCGIKVVAQYARAMHLDPLRLHARHLLEEDRTKLRLLPLEEVLEVHQVRPSALAPVSVPIPVCGGILPIVPIVVPVRGLAVRRVVGPIRAVPPEEERGQRARAPERERGNAFPVDKARERPRGVDEDVLGREVVVEDRGALGWHVGHAWGEDAREEACETGGEGMRFLGFFQLVLVLVLGV